MTSSHQLNLKKTATNVLQSLNLTKIPQLQVAFCLDASGSMEKDYELSYNNSNNYEHSKYQSNVGRLINHVYAVASNLDDNGEFELFMFSCKAVQLESVTHDTLPKQSELTKEVFNDISSGTDYATGLNKVYKHYFLKKEEQDVAKVSLNMKIDSDSIFSTFLSSVISLYAFTLGLLKLIFNSKDVKKEKKIIEVEEDSNDPVYLIFFTDGENSDSTDTLYILDKLKDLNIFIQFITVGNHKINQSYINRYNNTSVVNIPSTNIENSEEFFTKLFKNDRFLNFIKK